MIIALNEIPIRDLYEGYHNNYEEGVIGYFGRLDIRPKYQREFIYKEKQRNAVLDTVQKGFPLNVMYWVKIGQNQLGEDLYEVMDGQQRTISICEYINGTFAIDYKNFHNLPVDKREQILDYKLMVYICEGTDSEKLDWFRTVNIAGEKLTDQELRNAVYAGAWTNDAKRYFSRTNAPAAQFADGYISGTPIRQDILEKAISWISEGQIEQYMADHQHDKNANELWLYFQNVINWAKILFPHTKKEMKTVDWGPLYNKYKHHSFDASEFAKKEEELRLNDDVTSKKGIYPYLITGDEKYLSIRSFTQAMKIEAYHRQKGICVHCKEYFTIEEMEGDHITPFKEGGKTIVDNLQMLCKDCNRRKGSK